VCLHSSRGGLFETRPGYSVTNVTAAKVTKPQRAYDSVHAVERTDGHFRPYFSRAVQVWRFGLRVCLCLVCDAQNFCITE
jgi:hypothetical protein